MCSGPHIIDLLQTTHQAPSIPCVWFNPRTAEHTTRPLSHAKTPRRQEDRRAFGHVGYVQRSPYNRFATNDPPSTIHSMRMVQPKDRGTYQPFLPHAKTPVSELIRTTRDLVVWGTRLNVVILDAIRLCNQVLAVDANNPILDSLSHRLVFDVNIDLLTYRRTYRLRADGVNHLHHSCIDPLGHRSRQITLGYYQRLRAHIR